MSIFCLFIPCHLEKEEETLRQQIWWLFLKDIGLEWRRRDRVMAMFFFVVLSLGVYGLALQIDPTLQAMILPGVIWATLAFAGTIMMGNLYSGEVEDGGIDGLRMAPVSREAIFLGKQCSLFLFLLLCASWSVPLAGLMFQVKLSALFPKSIPVFILGLWGFSIVGTFMSTLLLETRFREVLLPLLFLPVVLPLLIVGARATSEITNPTGITQIAFWIRGMFVFDLFFLVVCVWLFPPLLDK